MLTITKRTTISSNDHNKTTLAIKNVTSRKQIRLWMAKETSMICGAKFDQ